MTILQTLGTRSDRVKKFQDVNTCTKNAVNTEEPENNRRHQNDDNLMVHLLLTRDIFDALMKL